MSNINMRQILDVEGNLIRGKEKEPKLTTSQLSKMYETMVMVRLLDDKGVKLQRQGRIGFYVGATGQEAVPIGVAAALEKDDWILPSYRELGLAFYRGYTIQSLANQWFGNKDDLQKGRELPCLTGSKEFNFLCPSAPISTQVIQAAGVGYGIRYLKNKSVCVTFFGDGGTSANDFHSGMNFAAVLKTPTVFVCQNNQWAISVPLSQQTAAETIALKAVGYGMPSERVDGNDILAVYTAAQESITRARRGEGPSLIEALTYRLGPHTTSDDPTRYRKEEEVEKWRQQDPVRRFKLFLEKKDLWSEKQETELRDRINKEIDAAVDSAEATDPPSIETMFSDVYHDLPWHLKEQYEQLSEFRDKYR